MHPFTLLFFLFPLLELTLLILAGMAVGGLTVILWVVLSAVIGVAALQRAGWKTWLQGDWRQQPGGESPAAQLADGVLLSTGGFLLFLPGLITDALGLLLLLPATRRRVVGAFSRIASVSRWSSSRTHSRSTYRRDEGGVTLDGEYWRDESGTRRPDDHRLP